MFCAPLFRQTSVNYKDATQWSTTCHVQVSTVNPYDVPLVDGSRPANYKLIETVTKKQKRLEKNNTA